MIHLGFTQDEGNRKVYDGASPIIAGKRVTLNTRFALPDGAGKLYEAGAEGPQWWRDWPERVRGWPAKGILDGGPANNSCPKFFKHLGAAERWGLRLSPWLFGTSGAKGIAR